MTLILGVDPAENNTGLALISYENETVGDIEVLKTILIPEYRPGRFFTAVSDIRIGHIDIAYVEQPPAGKGKMSAGGLRTLFASYGAIREAIAMCGIKVIEVPVRDWRAAMLGEPPFAPINKRKDNGEWIHRRYWTKGGRKSVELTIPDNLTPAVTAAVSRYCHPDMSRDEMEAILVAIYGAIHKKGRM